MHWRHISRAQQRVRANGLLHIASQRYSTQSNIRVASNWPLHLSGATAAAGLLLYGQSHGYFDKVGGYLYQSQPRCDSSERFARWAHSAPIIGTGRDNTKKEGSTESSRPYKTDASSSSNSQESENPSPPPQAQKSEENENDSKWFSLPTNLGDKISDLLVPDWVRLLPEFITKLQNEMSLAPGSLAEQIWWEAHDPESNPEIVWDATVRVSNDLCPQEKKFLENRKVFTKKALAQYLDLKEDEIHPDDIPVIAMCGSGGGLRALVAGSSSYLSAQEAGLFDCVTYTAGVSGSCWLQTLFYSSITGQNHQNLIRHLKNRLGVHIAFPPAALSLINSAPTNKYLLSGVVEKLKGLPNADFGIVDVYGILLAARLLVPKGELGIDDDDLKVSTQRRYIDGGKFPLPIYTAVRHEIPFEEQDEKTVAAAQERARREAWFQWFETTPYEFWCEEFEAGIPTWAVGRQFEGGKTKWGDNGLVLPETRITLLMGIWGSAFCATLSHYYKEIRPIMKSLAGFGGIDQLIAERDDALVKIHPIDPATIPNFVHGMKGSLPSSVPESVYKSEYLQLMDAGMSNNLPIYPLLRPGREVDILIAFDASADVKQDNWLKVVDGYARQRGIKGWPIGAGWPTEDESKEQITQDLNAAQASNEQEAMDKLIKAQDADKRKSENNKDTTTKDTKAAKADPKPQKQPKDLGYCNIWVGTTEERTSDSEPPPSKLVEEDWQLTHPDAGICVIYFPFLPNEKVAGVDPQVSDFMSTWNFVYKPDEIDSVVRLAKANFEAGAEQTRRTVRAVYERKKMRREERERRGKEEWTRRKVRLGRAGKHLGEGDHGDHFS